MAGATAPNADLPQTTDKESTVSAEPTQEAAFFSTIRSWGIVRADNKRLARINLMRDILSRLHYAGRKDKLVRPDPDIVFEFSPDCLEAGRLAR